MEVLLTAAEVVLIFLRLIRKEEVLIERSVAVLRASWAGLLRCHHHRSLHHWSLRGVHRVPQEQWPLAQVDAGEEEEVVRAEERDQISHQEWRQGVVGQVKAEH